MHIIRLALIVAAFIGIAAGPLRAAETPQPQSDDRVLGDPKAPIVIYEFASLTCPHCAAFEAETLPKLKTEWIDTGKAKLILRDYPLDQSALLAAMVARCAPPDRFYAFIDTLFQSQQSWEQSPKASLARIAKVGGMSQAEFDQCIADQKLSDSIIAARLKAQQSYGVASTPTFFINGKKVVGELPYDEFVKNLNGSAANEPQYIGVTTTAAFEPLPAPTPAPGMLDRARQWLGSFMSRG
jgi:protein-disulfide isomerase